MKMINACIGCICCLFIAKNHVENIALIWRRYLYRWRAVKFWPVFDTFDLWAERYLYHVTPAVTRALGVCSLIWSVAHCVALYDRQMVWGVATYIIALYIGRHYMSVLGAHIVALKQYCRWDEIFTLHVLRAHIFIVSPHC